ncbi:proline and serine-rich protein 3 isoform X1 [Gopherus evgoodei]|uniref:proline and serine-rich protein 3 isoform X1 n=1 Tax=Gopherus evgoodei TaxID=1825980 RepID=UPI0011CEDA21|nr:proline and serine-rich protein 3 isoform X1 [Gopherus evgoodei]
MESSTALFSVQGSPFAMKSPARSHYHPSPTRLPGPQHQCMTLSPARLLTSVPALAPHQWRPPEPTASSPPDLSFLQGPTCWGTALDSDSTNPFPESWPSTERSSPSTPQESPALRLGGPGAASAQDGESIIAKYIERFRHGQPSSRSQRQVPPISTAREFWWLEPAPPSDSSTPKGGTKPDCAKLEEVRPGWVLVSPPLRPMVRSPLRHLPAGLAGPRQPQPAGESHPAAAEKLACCSCSESSLSSTIPVSSEGLHSTPPSSTADSDQALPSPSHLSLPEPSPEPWPPARIPQCSSSIRPEDDILFQWRLRRKMEQASQADRSLPLLDWRTQLAWGPRMGHGACMAHPGVGLLPGAGDGAAFPAPAAQPEVRSGLEWAPGSSALRQEMRHPLEVPFLSAKPAVGQNPIAVHVLGQLASAATPSSTPQPEGDGGGAAERWSSKDARQGMGPAEHPASQVSQQGAGLAEQPISQDARRAAGPSEQPVSQDARWGVGLAEQPVLQDAQWAAGPSERFVPHDARWALGQAERHSSRDARRAAGPAERHGSRDARRAAGPAERHGSRDARRAAEPAERHSSRDAQRAAGPAERHGSRDAQRAAGPAGRHGSQDVRQAAEPAERHGSRDTRRAAEPAERHGSRDARRAAGPAERHSSRDVRRAAEPAERHGSRDTRRAAGPAERHSSRDTRWAAGPAEWHSSRDAQQGAWAVGVAQHMPKETERPSKPQLRRGRAATEPEATPSWSRRGRKGESSIHGVLGQVISERLFSSPASHSPTRGCQSGEGAVSPPEQSAAEKLPAPDSQHPQLLQLAVQLLEEAEESDGTEFEEDPLLEVLRGQREDLCSQLRAVDIAVSRLMSQGLAEPLGCPH